MLDVMSSMIVKDGRTSLQVVITVDRILWTG